MRNRKGVTLVELLISLVVLLFVSLALMQTALVSIDSNMRNLIRSEAVSVAEQLINDTRNTPYSDVSLVDTGGAWDTATFPDQPLQARNVTVTFTRARWIVDHGPDNKEVKVRIGWQWKGEQYYYYFSSVIRNQ